MSFLFGSKFDPFMRLLKCVLLIMLITVPALAMAQERVSSDDSIVTMRELWRIHKAERIERGMRTRLDTLNGRVPVLSARTNLLRWLTFTPDVGIIWHCAPKWDVQLNASWTSVTFSLRNRKRYALWIVSPEIRRYIGKNERYYVGAQVEISQRNYKITGLGRQGFVYGGGLVGGYQWRVTRHTSIDINFGVGVNWGKMQYYSDLPLFEGQDPRFPMDYEQKERRIGPNHLGVSLVWDLYGRKGGSR